MSNVIHFVVQALGIKVELENNEEARGLRWRKQSGRICITAICGYETAVNMSDACGIPEPAVRAELGHPDRDRSSSLVKMP